MIPAAMDWLARQLAPWKAWFAGREYRRQLERERRQRAFMAEYEDADQREQQARKAHRPLTEFQRRKVMIKVKMMQEGF